jgi:hypothetical protein
MGEDFLAMGILMIIYDLSAIGISVFPTEAETILLIDPDAVLALAVATKFFELIAWGDPKVVQIGCGIEDK